MTDAVPFGPLEGFLAVRPEAVDAAVWRGVDTVKRSRDVDRVYTATGTTVRLALAELSDRDVWKAEGHEADADFRGVVLASHVADGDVVEGDGLVVAAAAAHHAGRKFHIVAARDPHGRAGRLLLREDAGADFG